MNLKESRLLVTPTSYGKNDPRLRTELETQVGQGHLQPDWQSLTPMRSHGFSPAWMDTSPGWM
jgi:hypothetical protein